MTLTIVPKDAEALLTWPGLLDAFEAQDGPRASDLILRFIYDAETAYRHIEE